MNFQRLRGQNLLRHTAIQQIISSNNSILFGDSVSFYGLIYIALWSRGKFICHALELYSISYRALISEYSARLRVIKGNPFVVMKALVGVIRGLTRVYLMRKVISRNKMLLVSSEPRKRYLEAEGLKTNIQVVKNKPIYNKDEAKKERARDNTIVLIGSMYENTEDFKIISEYANRMNYKIHCYGLTKGDIEWVKKQKFQNVFFFGTVNYTLIPDLLRGAKFALCLYSSDTTNNQLSASSKIFEILYHGVVPIVSSNEGLISELIAIGASYIEVKNINDVDVNTLSNSKLYGSDSCTFSSEISKIHLL